MNMELFGEKGKSLINTEYDVSCQDDIVSLDFSNLFSAAIYEAYGEMAFKNSYPVSPTTNFVMVEGDKLTLQLGFTGRIGANGLGGITIEGNISSYDIPDMPETRD